MILKKQRTELKKVLGYHYTYEVLKILKREGVKSRRGTPYGTSMIRNVFNGLNENKAIENAIMELYINTLEERQKTLELRNKILGISGSEDRV